VPSRHIAPRHKSPRSLKRTLGRFAGDIAGAVPASGVTGAVALVAAAGVAVGIGVFTVGADAKPQQTAASAKAGSKADDAIQGTGGKHRGQVQEISRSSSRPVLASVQRETKAKHLPVSRQAVSGAVSETVEASDPRDIALSMLGDYGWSSDEFSCLDSLWVSESNWNPAATNSSSGAYGIPQSLPAEKMASAGSDWRTNPATQIEWGLDYIQSSYGSPCNAWYFKQGNNWY
jgi:transglycosylase-like protein with SLT domain